MRGAGDRASRAEAEHPLDDAPAPAAPLPESLPEAPAAPSSPAAAPQRFNNRQVIHLQGLRFKANLGILDFEHRVDGSGGCFLYMPAGGSLKPATPETVAAKEEEKVVEIPQGEQLGGAGVVSRRRGWQLWAGTGTSATQAHSTGVDTETEKRFLNNV